MLSGTVAEIKSQLKALAEEEHSVWCSVENTGEYEPGLVENLNEVIRGSQVKIITCRNRAVNPAVIERLPEDRHLADLKPVDVFQMMLVEKQIDGDNADLLLAAFNEIETAAREEDN